MIISKLNLTKFKLEFLKSDFKCKKHEMKNFASLEFDIFRVQLKFALRIRP